MTPSAAAWPRRLPWWAAVFVLALGARLAFLLIADEPLLYTHQYNYFAGGLAIATHPDPWNFVLRSDEWHTWNGPWTMAPLYHLFVGACFRLIGAHVFPVLVLQCVLDALAAVMVGRLGRDLAGGRGTWAGIAYAVYWPAVELPSRFFTENLHTPLLLAGFVLLSAWTARRHERSGWRWAAGAGAVLGLSALARSVSAGFLPLAAVWLWRSAGHRRGLPSAAALLLGGACVVLPWSARNAFVVGDPVLIETVGVWNLWTDNTFVDEERYDVQRHLILKQPTLAAGRDLAAEFARRGITTRPRQFVVKVWDNFRHLVRPEGLYRLLQLELPQTAKRHAAWLLLDDALLVPSLALLALFAFAGARSPGRALMLSWVAYYLAMVVVVFHNEIRYRSALMPFALVAAVAMVGSPRTAGRLRGLGALAAAALVAIMLGPFVAPAAQAVDARWRLRAAIAALDRGDPGAAELAALDAVTHDPSSPRPWLVYARALVKRGHDAAAIAAYQRAQLRNRDSFVARFALPRLFREQGRSDDADMAVREANGWSLHADPWLGQEIAWRELPPRVTDEVVLGGEDYGLVRGFLHPHENHRWSRHRAWIRLRPRTAAAAYDVTLVMSSPGPSPHQSPAVYVRANDGPAVRFVLEQQPHPYRVGRVQVPPGGVLLVRLDAPTWNLPGQPAEQGVRVDSLTVAPAGGQ